jgi:hypothetical protein
MVYVVLAVECGLNGAYFVCREQGTVEMLGGRKAIHFVIEAISLSSGVSSTEEIEAFLRSCVLNYEPCCASLTLARIAARRGISLPSGLDVRELHRLV